MTKCDFECSEGSSRSALQGVGMQKHYSRSVFFVTFLNVSNLHREKHGGHYAYNLSRRGVFTSSPHGSKQDKKHLKTESKL